MFRTVIVFFLLLTFGACRPEAYHPKPSGYYRLDTPATHQYLQFSYPGFPYSFEYPANSTVSRDTVFKGDQDNKYWINIHVHGMEGIFNITYKEISEKQPLYKLMDDAWGLSYFHHEKADYIDPVGFVNEYGVSGMLYTVGGNSASRYQFAATDSVKHFLRGALYFDVTPNADSLQPVTDFLLKDIQHMLLTLQWHENK